MHITATGNTIIVEQDQHGNVRIRIVRDDTGVCLIGDPWVYYNREITVTVYCPINSPSGYSVSVTIPRATFASVISQEDADAQAQAEAESQAEAQQDCGCQPAGDYYYCNNGNLNRYTADGDCEAGEITLVESDSFYCEDTTTTTTTTTTLPPCINITESFVPAGNNKYLVSTVINGQTYGVVFKFNFTSWTILDYIFQYQQDYIYPDIGTTFDAGESIVVTLGGVILCVDLCIPLAVDSSSSVPSGTIIFIGDQCYVTVHTDDYTTTTSSTSTGPTTTTTTSTSTTGPTTTTTSTSTTGPTTTTSTTSTTSTTTAAPTTTTTTNTTTEPECIPTESFLVDMTYGFGPHSGTGIVYWAMVNGLFVGFIFKVMPDGTYQYVTPLIQGKLTSWYPTSGNPGGSFPPPASATVNGIDICIKVTTTTTTTPTTTTQTTSTSSTSTSSSSSTTTSTSTSSSSTTSTTSTTTAPAFWNTEQSFTVDCETPPTTTTTSTSTTSTSTTSTSTTSTTSTTTFTTRPPSGCASQCLSAGGTWGSNGGWPLLDCGCCAHYAPVAGGVGWWGCNGQCDQHGPGFCPGPMR